jgi:dTDP-glucose 4,6-dehydratase
MAMDSLVIVTGGAGFIGSNFLLRWAQQRRGSVINIDKLTYAGNAKNLANLAGRADYRLVHGDIGQRDLVAQLLKQHRPCAIVNFAAESHVDRSIHSPEDFIQTNIVGTFHLLEEARAYWDALPADEKGRFRFLHVSTDEVYGSLTAQDSPFSEATAYAPNSPYAASKAASDHLVRAYFHTYGLPTLTTNCSNNYGPYQFPEKLIPLMILNALSGKSLPVYGDGLNVRDWLYVGDHCIAIQAVLERGRPGETYNVGGRSEKLNIDVVRTICALLDDLHPDSPVTPHEKLVTYVKDRLGHDRRYAIDSSKIERELGWQPVETFESGIRKTVQWYLDHQDWVRSVTSGEYRKWVELNYGERTET